MTPSDPTNFRVVDICFLPPDVDSRYPRAADFVRSGTVQEAWVKTESIHPQARLRNVLIACDVETQGRSSCKSWERLYFRHPEMTAQQFQTVLDCCNETQDSSLRVTQCWLKLFPNSVKDVWGDTVNPK